MRCNKKELAAIISVTEATLSAWQRDGMPIAVDAARGNPNEYDTRVVINWMIAREVNKNFEDGVIVEGGRLDSDHQLARLRSAQAEKTEIEVDLLKGRVLDAEEVQLEMGRIDAEVRQALLSRHARLAPLLVKIRSVKPMAEALKKDTLDTLEKLSSSGSKAPGL